jgi:D-alanine-D-alanine ligase
MPGSRGAGLPHSNNNNISIVYADLSDFIKKPRRNIVSEDNKSCVNSIADGLESKGYRTAMVPFKWKSEESTRVLAEEKLKGSTVFNQFEGAGNPFHESVFVKILEDMGIPYTGNSSWTLGAALNKEKAKKLLVEKGIRTPKGFVILHEPQIAPALENLSFPVFVKPACEDASVGIDEDSIIKNREGAAERIMKKLDLFPLYGVLVEEFISGSEFSVGMLGAYPYRILPISMIDYSRVEHAVPFVTFKSKWDKNSYDWKEIVPVFNHGRNDRKVEEVRAIASESGKILRCEGFFRVDIRENDKGELFVLDVNPNPDLSKDAGFAKQAREAGISYQDLLDDIVKLAERTRHEKSA